MLGHQPFTHDNIRANTVIFGRIFNKLTIVRRHDDGAEERRVKVPLVYGPKEKWYQRIITDPKLSKQTEMSLPMMSFEITSYAYDGSRRLPAKNRISKTKSADVRSHVYNPVPYDLTVELNIYSRWADDINQILEQILPFFGPEFTVAAQAAGEMEINIDTPIIINSVGKNDDYTSDFTTHRLLTWTLTFTMKTYFYGPIRDEGVIKKASVDHHVVPSTPGPVTPDQVEASPRISRFTTEVDPITASKDDDWEYKEELEHFDDGLKYNPETGQDEPID